MVLWNVNSWAAFCVDEGYPTITSILPKKLALFFFSCNRLLKKDFGMEDRREGKRDWFPSERNKVHSALLDMHALEFCPRSLPYALFDLLIPKHHLLQASRPLLHLPYKEEKWSTRSC